ncbi:OB-fold nucleic acid binding domain-containing protein [Haloarchaeobius amylolyticus]|uniref:OB-fold nucleic acid binding domain-containing protein n=1 Tax=Haloarchaeobius amylolyticus TaxID=1198296 RepID=UPI0022704DED|nr:OB-fold nucleic acid binding domain-containing protein [Haloarchaeobius amylolyticus]
MGNCIICGASVDGHICKSHEEDVVFVFEGNSPNQLTPGRYYEGSVDGFAEFGVFVDIGTSVTGLLHRSELDRRLDSLDWQSGDTVYVQVTDVRDNGNIDLGWSIRQDEAEFRGKLIDNPSGDKLPEEEEKQEVAATTEGTQQATTQVRTPDGSDATPSSDKTEEPGEAPDEGNADSASDASGADDEQDGTDESAQAESAQAESAQDESAADEPATADESDAAPEPSDDEPLARTQIDGLTEQVGQVVSIEGEVISVRQTSGPTVFELRDESGVIECAAFEEAGVRAYPDVSVDDVVRLEGEVERRHDNIQVETESLTILEGEEAAAVDERMQAAIDDEADPGSIDLLADHDAVAAVTDEIREVATAIRRAVIESRPVVVRHRATAEGYVAGAAIERAVLPLVREEHARDDAVYHFFERRPLDEPVYDMDAATNDVTDMLDARERHGEQLPLVVLADLGSTLESRESYDLLDVYDADRVVVDAGHPDEEIVDSVAGIVNPHLAGSGDDVTSATLAANVAAHVNEDVREDLRHLPAVSFWADAPSAYTDLASEAGYDADETRELREAIALEAYYQSYKDKRELITDLLFNESDGLAGHVSEQFRIKLERELETARRNVSTRTAKGIEFAVLDADAFTHRFDFPPTELLLEALHREQAAETDETLVTLALGDDDLYLRSTDHVDMRGVADEVAEVVPESGLSVVGGRDGHLEYLSGEREDVLNATVSAIAKSFKP